VPGSLCLEHYYSKSNTLFIKLLWRTRVKQHAAQHSGRERTVGEPRSRKVGSSRQHKSGKKVPLVKPTCGTLDE
jgi:hypothetical protein